MTSADVNMLLEHYKVQVSELSRICGELTRMQHVNNKIIGVLERHIRDDIGNNNTENRSVLGELRDLLHIGDFSKSNVELMVATYNSSPSDEPTLNTVVERENWHRSHEVHVPQSQPTYAPKQIDSEQVLSVPEPKTNLKEQQSPHDVTTASDSGSSPSKTASWRHVSISPQKHVDTSPTRGSAAYSVSPARRNISSASPRYANDEVASSFDENAEHSPSRADHARSDVSDERHMVPDVPTDRYKAGVISSAELNKLVDELSHVSPSKPRPAALRPEPRLDKRPDMQAYHPTDYDVDADADAESDVYLARPHTAPAPVLHESGVVVYGPSSIAASVRAKYPDTIVRQSSSRQRLSWLHDPLLQHAFRRLPWLVRGHLTRQLLQTDKVQQLKRIIRDSADIFADLYREIRERARLQAQTASNRVQPAAPPTLTTEQKFLRDRILKQLRAALIDVHITFHETSEHEQVRFIMQHHAALRERERRSRNLGLGFDADSSVEDEVASPRERLTPRLSSATLKKLEREARERSNSQHNVVRADELTNGMNGGAPRRVAARITRTRSAGAMENRPRTAPAQARDLPPSRPRNAVVNGNGLDSKSRVLRNVQQAAVEKDRPSHRPTHLQLGVKAQPAPAANGMTYTKSTNAATMAQRLRDRSKSHNVVFDSDGRP